MTDKPKLPEDNELMCYICNPPVPLKDHIAYKGVLIHGRTEVEPGVVYSINESDFKLNET